MSISGIQGRTLEVTVVGCSGLKDTEWLSKQDPYVCVEYASTKCRTKTCTDGHKNPSFQERFVFTLIEGLREVSIEVWNSNTLSSDDFIGSGKFFRKDMTIAHGLFKRDLEDMQVKHESFYIMRTQGNQTSHSIPSAPTYVSHSVPQPFLYLVPPPVSTAPYGAPNIAYPTASAYSAYPPPPPPSAYPPPPYRRPLPTAYPPPPYPPTSFYPPPPHGPPHYPPGPYPGHYPPPY